MLQNSCSCLLNFKISNLSILISTQKNYLKANLIIFQDRLYNLAHDFLCQARLPAFAVPTAIDVLTTGTYPDLPRAIKDRYVPPEPLSPEGKEKTLIRLDQVIKCRLVSCSLPPRITDFRVQKEGLQNFREYNVTPIYSRYQITNEVILLFN